MRSTNFSVRPAVALAILAVSLIATGTPATAQREKVLHNFEEGGYYGSFPGSSLILDSSGNLYGTTPIGDIREGGIVFELSPKTTGTGWTATTVHAFSGTAGDGSDPVASLIFDAAGNLYGTTYSSGAYGWGTVFELSPTTGGTWTETILYSFGNGSDAQHPGSSLILDAAGNLYGTTYSGGTDNLGAVFELSPAAGGGWTETVLHSFSTGTDGQYPQSALILDPAGNLYGTTTLGGAYNIGTVFELSPADNTWTEKILHSFKPNGHDGGIPFAGLTMDHAGNLYGTTNFGGLYGYGTVFEIKPASQSEKILYSFSGRPDGEYPYAGVIFDTSGNLYGTTTDGGTAGAGAVFKMTSTSTGWTETVVHSFGAGNSTDGSYPDAGVVFDTLGNLYGTTTYGGTYDDGTVFAIRP